MCVVGHGNGRMGEGRDGWVDGMHAREIQGGVGRMPVDAKAVHECEVIH